MGSHRRKAWSKEHLASGPQRGPRIGKKAALIGPGPFPIAGLSAVVVWGASFAATRIALQGMTPFGLVAARLWAGALLLIAAGRLRCGSPWPIRSDLSTCTLLGLILAAHVLIQAYGLLHTTAVHTGWIIGFIPVTIALGAHLLGQQRLGHTGWLGVVLGAGGVLTVMSVRIPEFDRARWGDLLQLVSCLTWTVYTLASAGPVTRNGVLRVTAFGLTVAAAVSTAAAVSIRAFSGPLTWSVLAAVAFLGPVCSGLAYYLWFAAVDRHGPARVGVLLYLEPFVALVTGARLLGEPVGWNSIIGGLCVLTGVWLVNRDSAPPAPHPRGGREPRAA